MDEDRKKKISDAMKEHWKKRRSDKYKVQRSSDFKLKASERMKEYWARKTEEERKMQGRLLHSNEEQRLANLRKPRITLKDFRSLGEVMSVELAKQRAMIDNEPRDEVRFFSFGMEQKLKKRDNYGGWRHLPLDYLAKKLDAEMRELLISLKYESPDEVMSECIDVANFAMFIWDIMRSQPDNRVGTVRRGSKDRAHGR